MKVRRTIAVAAAAGLVSVATATAALATADVEATRLAGANRYRTSQVVAEATFDSSTIAIVASGERFPDALAASYLAGANTAPVVLTLSDQLTPAAEAALADIGASGVLVVGGTAAVSDAVVDDLETAGYAVNRIFGANRYATARAIAESVPANTIGSLQADIGRTALLASGENFPDALSGGPLAYHSAFPLLLTSPTALSSSASTAIENLGIEHVVILGGTKAISADVEASVVDLGVDVLRVAGADRTQTAAELADLAVDQLGYSVTHVNLARGDDFADALSGSAHAGEEQALILLTASPDVLGQSTATWLQAQAGTLTTIHVLGGVAAVSDDTIDAAEVAAGRTP